MFSFEYFIGFIILGFVLRMFLSPVVSGLIIVGISVGWAFVFGPWAVLTFIELMIGWGAIQAAANAKSNGELDKSSDKEEFYD